jgi:succinyl-diaminopimelate desuccinylase
MTEAQALLSQLVAFESITPHDAGSQVYLSQELTALGFTCHTFDNPPVANLFARLGSGSPFFLFAGHTDVVPVGESDAWNSDPFTLTERDGMLYGRGCADMKGSIAAMLAAIKQFVATHPQFHGSIGLLITSGEEGDEFERGTPFVMQHLAHSNQLPDYCLVGEPSSNTRIGDVIRIGRRGSLSAHCVVHGIQGHVAYPQLADNPIHRVIPALNALLNTQWDNGNAHFPPTSLQLTAIQAGGQAGNIIPGQLALQFNFRYSTEQTAEQLIEQVQALFNQHQLNITIDWRVNGKPFLSAPGRLLTHCMELITALNGQPPELSTSGGTSDARFIAPFGIEVLELGPLNATIHQVNECIHKDELEQLSTLYYDLLVKLFINNIVVE